MRFRIAVVATAMVADTQGITAEAVKLGRGQPDQEVDAFLPDLRRQQVEDALDDLLQAEVPPVEQQLTRLDLRQVENIVDQVQKAARTTVDGCKPRCGGCGTCRYGSKPNASIKYSAASIIRSGSITVGEATPDR